MVKYINGDIPTKVCYAYSDECTLYLPFLGKEIPVLYTSAIYSSRKEKYKSLYYANKNSFKILPNNEIKNAKLLYDAKILINNNNIVNICESSYYEILDQGVSVGGTINAALKWVSCEFSSTYYNLDLYPVNGETYNSIVNYEAMKYSSRIKNSELEVGAIYQNIENEQFLFLGFTNSSSIRYLRKNKRFIINKPIKYPLFYLIDNNLEINNIHEINNYDILKRFDIDLIEFSKNNLIEKIGKINLPNNIVDYISDFCKNRIKSMLLEFSNGKLSIVNFANIVSDNYRFINQNDNIFDINKYLNFI